MSVLGRGADDGDILFFFFCGELGIEIWGSRCGSDRYCTYDGVEELFLWILEL